MANMKTKKTKKSTGPIILLTGATSPTAGSFTDTQLQKVLVEVDRIWADNQQAAQYMPMVDALLAIKEQQTSTIETQLQDTQKDHVVRITWAADCNDATEEPSDTCEIGGPSPETGAKDYELTLKRTTGFTIEEIQLRSNTYTKEQLMAKSLARRLKVMDEYLARAVVGKLNAFAGSNLFTTGLGKVVGGDTYIESGLWTPNLMGEFARIARKNKLMNTFLLHGDNMFMQNWNAQMNNANIDQKAELLKMGSMKQYNDLFNVDAVNTPDRISYLISRGAVAFASKNYWPDTPMTMDNPTRKLYTIASNSLPGVKYDLAYRNRCVSNKVYHDMSLYAYFDIFLNPLGCNTDVTGVLRMFCGNPPTGSSS